MIRILSILSIAACSLSMAFGLAKTEPGQALLVPGLIFIGWTLALQVKRYSFSNIFLILIFAIAAYHLYMQADPVWIMIGCGFAILAWDLDLFHRYLSSVDAVVSKQTVISRHIVRWSALLLISTFMALAATQINLTLNLFLVLTLAALLLVVVNRNTIR